MKFDYSAIFDTEEFDTHISNKFLRNTTFAQPQEIYIMYGLQHKCIRRNCVTLLP